MSNTEDIGSDWHVSIGFAQILIFFFVVVVVVVALYWFSMLYPEETVLNIANDLAFAHACAGAAGEPLRGLLQRV